MTINGFKLHDTNSAPSVSAEIMDGVQRVWGFVPNLHRVLASFPLRPTASQLPPPPWD